MQGALVGLFDFVGYAVADPNHVIVVGGGKGPKFGPSHQIIQAMLYQQHSRSILDKQSMVVANVLKQRIAKQGMEYQREEIRRRQLLISSSLAVILSEV